MNARMEKFLEKVFLLFHKELTDNMANSLIQFIKFGIVGVSNTVIAYLLNVFVLLILKPFDISWDYVAGNVVSFILSVLWSFFWNNKFVFTVSDGESRSLWKTLLKTYVAYGFTGILLNNILSWVWISVFSISKFVAPLINLLISVPLNFIVNKFWAFSSKTMQSEEKF